MTLLKNIYASIVIFASNFTARWGTLVNLLLLAALAILLLTGLIRAL